jgi:hypothetical protein
MKTEGVASKRSSAADDVEGRPRAWAAGASPSASPACGTGSQPTGGGARARAALSPPAPSTRAAPRPPPRRSSVPPLLQAPPAPPPWPTPQQSSLPHKGPHKGTASSSKSECMNSISKSRSLNQTRPICAKAGRTFRPISCAGTSPTAPRLPPPPPPVPPPPHCSMKHQSPLHQHIALLPTVVQYSSRPRALYQLTAYHLRHTAAGLPQHRVGSGAKAGARHIIWSHLMWQSRHLLTHASIAQDAPHPTGTEKAKR